MLLLFQGWPAIGQAWFNPFAPFAFIIVALANPEVELGLAFVTNGLAFLTNLPGTTGWSDTLAYVPTELWLPEVQTTDTSFGVNTNGFGFNIIWAIGQTVVVEASADLINWQPVQTNTLTSGSAYFSDAQWTNYPARFYRLRAP